MHDRPPPLNRRAALLLSVAAVLGMSPEQTTLGATLPEVVVYLEAGCDCCQRWITHLQREGFRVRAQYTNDLDTLNDAWGVPPALRGCHAARVDSYIIEGHVPADDIRRLLIERPKAVGLSVPGMPIGAPGMEQGSARTPYEVVLFGGGTTSRFAMH